MEENGLIEDSQHGFVRGRSCGTNLVEFFDFVTEALDGGTSADAIFLDFAKAFDKVPHRRLITKLRGLGIGGEILRWIENWLADRKQRVVIDGEKSSWESVVSGVPQGSVLGPVLFLIFIKDLDGAVTENTKLRKFADDSKLARKLQEDRDMEELQETLNRMLVWAQDWGMEFNKQKCKVMHFGRNNPRFQYRMGDHALAETVEEKDVGVYISNNMKPSAHCIRAAKTASTVLGQIGRSFKYRDKNIFPKLYTRYVRPHLEFSSPAWNPWHQKDIDTLERVQMRAVNMVNGLGGLPYEAKLEALGLQSLSERRTDADLLLMYKVHSGKCTVNPALWYQVASRPGQQTRASSDLLNVRKPFARTDIRKNFYTVRICDLWNGLPNNVRAARTVAKFKFNYRQHKQNTRRRQGAS
jgi:hypothetical protein